MPRFLFHFAAPGIFVADEEGKNLASLEAAHMRAVRLVEQATCFFEDASDWRGWTVRVCSPENRLLLAVLFPGQGRPPDR